MKNPAVQFAEYLKGVNAEVRKVVWPTVPTLLRHLASVVAGLVLFTVFVGAVDYVFIQALAFLVRQ